MKREQVAAAAAVSVQHLWALESGRSQPSLALARRLAAALQATVDQLFPEAA